MALAEDNEQKTTILSIYKLDTKTHTGFEDWRLLWDFVNENYGSKAICQNIIRIEASYVDVSVFLDQSCDKKTWLSSLLTKERACGATHAFVQPEKGGAVFGVNLDAIVTI